MYMNGSYEVMKKLESATRKRRQAAWNRFYNYRVSNDVTGTGYSYTSYANRQFKRERKTAGWRRVQKWAVRQVRDSFWRDSLLTGKVAGVRL